MNPVEAIHVSVGAPDNHQRVWITVMRRFMRPRASTWSRTYYHVTPSSLARAQRAQWLLARSWGEEESLP